MGCKEKVMQYTVLKTVLIELEARLQEPYCVRIDPGVLHQAFYDAMQRFPEMDSSGVVKRRAPYCHGLETAIAWSMDAGEIFFRGPRIPEELVLCKPSELRKAALEEQYANNRRIGRYICDRVEALQAERAA